MRDHSTPHESPPQHPPLTKRGLVAIAALIAAFPLALYAIEHPTAAATTLLAFGAVASAFRRQ